jgi:hypothetical protein
MRDREPLLWQSDAAHKVRVAGVGTYRVERRIADTENQLIVAVRKRPLEVLEHLVTISGKREAYSDGAHGINDCGRRERQPAVALGVCAPGAGDLRGFLKFTHCLREVASRGI